MAITMTEKHTLSDPHHNREARYEEIRLLGQPQLGDYLHYVRKTVIGGSDIHRATLVDEWREANDYYYDLEQSEAGIADQVDHRDLDPDLTPLVEEVKNDPRYVNTFDTLPVRFGMVELEKLIVYQINVTRQFVDGLASRIGPDPDPESLFRFCLPLEASNAPVRIQRIGPRRYSFISESSDLRLHDTVLLKPDQLCGYASFGPIVGAVAVVVGFGSNFLNVIQVDNRLLLNNGYHRACAMYAAGIRYAPCIIETVTRRDELNLTADEAVRDNPAFYFKAKRPPLLKDFFDPKIRKILPVPKLLGTIEVSFETREHEIAE